MITVVLTSCGRLDLLFLTVNSLLQNFQYPIEEFIIIDDSGKKDVYDQLRNEFISDSFKLILNEENIGLIPSIDKAYSQVKTEYIFHCEDDWKFLRPGFIEKSITILKHDPKIMQVWLRGDQNPNGHPIEPEIFETDGVQYKLVATHVHGVWHGFSFNPTVRRLADYKLIAPWSEIHLDENRGIGVQENHIGRVYFEEYGFRAATLIDEYCIHTGDWNRTYANPSSMKANK
jgi:hypothetical protein